MSQKVLRLLLRAAFLQFLLCVARGLDILLLLLAFRGLLLLDDFLFRRFGFTSLSRLALVGVLGSFFPHCADLTGVNLY